MYPSLPVGPLSLPTAQILAIIAAWFGLSIMAQVGKHLRLHPDLIWNLGTLAFGVGVIVARLSHAVYFWPIYQAEPLLLVSLRPGGLVFWPGAAAALVAGYAYLIYKQAQPLPIAVAVVFGLLAGGAVLEVSHFLTGAAVGTRSMAAWAVAYFGEMRHPVALYRAMGMMLIIGSFLLWGNWHRPVRVAGQAIFAYALLRLLADAFSADTQLIGPVRVSQLLALTLSVGMAIALARTYKPKDE